MRAEPRRSSESSRAVISPVSNAFLQPKLKQRNQPQKKTVSSEAVIPSQMNQALFPVTEQRSSTKESQPELQVGSHLKPNLEQEKAKKMNAALSKRMMVPTPQVTSPNVTTPNMTHPTEDSEETVSERISDRSSPRPKHQLKVGLLKSDS